MTTTLITGGNTGIGYETALALAGAGHDLIITSRSLAAAQAAAARLRDAQPGAAVHPLALDLADFANVRAFAAQALARFPALDNAIFNAGIMAPPWAHTVDGFETQFQANYLGHFYLYELLREALLAARGQVISVSSLAGENSDVDTLAGFTALARVPEADYGGMTSYRASKLAQMLFTAELARREGAAGLRAYALHPGIVNSELFYRNYPDIFKTLVRPLVWLAVKSGRVLTPQEGAATTIYLATHEAAPNGSYWADSAPRPLPPAAQDPDLAAAFWAWSAAQTPA